MNQNDEQRRRQALASWAGFGDGEVGVTLELCVSPLN